KEGITNNKGDYSVQLGSNGGTFQDASVGGEAVNLGNPGQGGLTSDVSPNALWNCELRASLIGYRSESVSLANQRNADNHVINFVLHYVGDVKGGTISATSAQAPKDAQKAFEKGAAAHRASKPDDAQKELLKAVTTYPKFAIAWFELGQVYEDRGHQTEAKDAYLKSVDADGNFVPPYE